jgi:hypothetical protein
MNFKSLSFFALVLAASLYVVRAEDQNGEANTTPSQDNGYADFDEHDHDILDFDGQPSGGEQSQQEEH